MAMLPPELMAMMQGGGAPPMGGPGMPPPGMGGPGGPPQPPPQDETSYLKGLIDQMRQYQDYETADDEDLATVAKCMAAIQGLIAKQQKQADMATGAGPAAKFLRKTGGGAAPAGY